MCRTAILACIVSLLSTSIVGAQTAAAATPRDRAALLRDVQRRLQLGPASEVAWGAFLAAQYRLAEAIPAIEAALRTPASADRDGKSHLISALLDSLIQLDAHVPARQLEPYLSDWPVQTMILLTTASPGRDEVMLRQVKTTSGFPWYVAANTLVETKARGFVVELMGKWKLRLTITVSDDRRTTHFSSKGGGGMGMGVGDGIGVNPEGYPPTATYRFEMAPRRGHIVLSTGPHTVYYSRVVHTAQQYGASSLDIGGPTDDERVDYLTATVGGIAGDRVPLVARHETGIFWRPAETLPQRVSMLRDDAILRYRALILAPPRGTPSDPERGQFAVTEP